MAKCMDHNGDRNEHGGIVAGSRQIYLTFPAESTFSEIDVYNYFNTFGPVQDVRIPCQQKRMFGFVTFSFADTVRHILNKGNPHFVSGARVLVKPYREKCKVDDRKHEDSYQHQMYQGSHCLDTAHGLQPITRICDNSIKNQWPHSGTSLEDLLILEGNGAARQMKFPRFNNFLDVLNNGDVSEQEIRDIKTNTSEQESQGLDLPDSPFASGLSGEISTTM
ncbi:hypothetical protein R6Q57_008533 [Mikania cordata]